MCHDRSYVQGGMGGPKKKKSIKQALKSKRIGESSTDSNAKMALESSLERSLGGMGGGAGHSIQTEAACKKTQMFGLR